MLDINKEEIRNELDRRSMIRFASRMQPKYKWNWHHKKLADTLDKFFRGELKRVMVFVPPQHGKELSNMTDILTPSGWRKHSDLLVGDYVYGRNGQPVKVLGITAETMSEYDVEFSDGSIIQCHGNHEWVIWDRGLRREVIVDTHYLFERKLNSGTKKRGNRNHVQVDANVCLDNTEKNLPLHPYVLGAWLGDGTRKTNVLTHDKNDLAHIAHIASLGFPISNTRMHPTTGALTTGFKNLSAALKEAGVWMGKHIPEIYLNSSVEQRLQLLAGLIDTDGYVYHKNGRVCFSNINKRLIEDVRRLVISLGCRVTICKFKPTKPTDKYNIKGNSEIYQLCFNPNFHIPCILERKKTQKINPQIRKRGIVSVKKAINPEPGRCINVEGGIYLAGRTLIPTHNSEFTSRLFPAYALGKNPDLKIVLASYSASVAEKMNRDVQKYIETEDYAALFPETKLQAAGANGKYVRNAETFDIVDRGGYFKSVGVGGSLTGTPADIGIIDDPHKDREEAKSPVISQKVWEWYTDVFKTRLHNDSGVLLIQTRWDNMDLAGRILKEYEESIARGDKDIEHWTIICFPAIKENNNNPEDPRKTGDALWPEKHSLSRLNQIRNSSLRTFQSLYQQNPMPVQAGGECYKTFDVNLNTYDATAEGSWQYDPELPLHLSFDFNVNPYMSCGVFQVTKHYIQDSPYFKAYKIEEICLRSPHNSTRGACRHINTKYGSIHRSTCYIYGDPNGRKEDTRSEQGYNDYAIIKKELANFKPSFRVPTKAPAVATRIGFTCSIFAFGVAELEYYIEKKCVNTTNDYLYIKEESDGTKQKLKGIDPITGINSERYGHQSDLDDYFLTSAFPQIYNKHQKGATSSEIRLGSRQTRHGANNY